jgi:hypothetical protein
MPDENFELFSFVVIYPRNVRGGEFHKGILAEAHEFLARSRAVSDPWPILECPFKVSQQRKIIKPPGFSFEISKEIHGCLEISTIVVRFIMVCVFPCVPAIA